MRLMVFYTLSVLENTSDYLTTTSAAYMIAHTSMKTTANMTVSFLLDNRRTSNATNVNSGIYFLGNLFKALVLVEMILLSS